MRKCVSGCMSKDTRIMMGDGSEKIIAEICIGDTVCIKNETAKVISIQHMSYHDSVYNICLFNGTKDGIYANGFIVGDMDRQNRMYKVQEINELDILDELKLFSRESHRIK